MKKYYTAYTESKVEHGKINVVPESIIAEISIAEQFVSRADVNAKAVERLIREIQLLGKMNERIKIKISDGPV